MSEIEQLPALSLDTKELQELGFEPVTCRRLLIVDDEMENLDVVSALLDETCEVRSASNGMEALQVLEQSGPADMIIADQRMPGMTGVELLSRIAQTMPDTIRVVLTRYTDVEPMLDAINHGAAYRFLLKPFDPAELRSVVRNGLHLKSVAMTLARLVETLYARRSELRETRADLEQSQRKLMAAERLTTLGRTTSGIVHDLRNAASILHILLDIVRRDKDHPALLESAAVTWGSLSSLLDLLEQVRNFSQATTSDIRREPVDIADLLDTTLKIFRLEQLGKPCDVTLDISPEIKSIQLDRNRIRQALLALLRNAQQASEHGKPISVSVRSLGRNRVAIEVTDQGFGMSPAILSRAREAFFSAFEPQSTGLGLEIVRLAAESHGGQIEIESEPERGTIARMIVVETKSANDSNSDRPASETSPELVPQNRGLIPL